MERIPRDGVVSFLRALDGRRVATHDQQRHGGNRKQKQVVHQKRTMQCPMVLPPRGSKIILLYVRRRTEHTVCEAETTRFQPRRIGHTMNFKLAASGLVVGALMLPIAGYTADSDSDRSSDRSSPKAFVKDSVITTKIKAELAEEKLSSLVHIGVDTDNKGMVTLSGNAASQNAADKAVAIARAVKGVTSVQNNIEIKAN
jgi:hyperosmotically inducible periplasmic protein